MKFLYEFTADERRVLLRARQMLNDKITFLAEVHGLEGNIMTDDGLTGILDPAAMDPAAAQ